jgi:hypothetical protein
VKKFLLVLTIIIAIYNPIISFKVIPHTPVPSPALSSKVFCTQVLIPIPEKPGWYWTDGCKTTMVKWGK